MVLIPIPIFSGFFFLVRVKSCLEILINILILVMTYRYVPRNVKISDFYFSFRSSHEKLKQTRNNYPSKYIWKKQKFREFIGKKHTLSPSSFKHQST